MNEFYTNVRVSKNMLEELRLLYEEFNQYFSDEYGEEKNETDILILIDMAISNEIKSYKEMSFYKEKHQND